MRRGKQDVPPDRMGPSSRSALRRPAIGLLAGIVILGGVLVGVDWWICLPEDTTATYVGRDGCVQCHTQQHRQWTGSHHDLAMDKATPESVLGDFGDAQFEHFGIQSRMYREDCKYMIRTEGPDGRMGDFQVKYVFGVDPLQQYMVEFDRTGDMPDEEIARLQVLRISWDTDNKRWFYLAPPDVDEKLAPDDPLHWTARGQNWNHMCADCHSTHLRKNYDLETRTYHTTFSEIDVSCEACHGPGSVHVQLAEQSSLFWDRKLGYGLARLKDKRSDVQIDTCAQCHSRRRHVYPGFQPGESFYDYFANELLQEATYHADGQIRDEVYVHGSFLQSKMYAKGIRCTDCHDAHTARLKHEGNRVCTSCHTHSVGKYDTPAHHHHKSGSRGALCVECHMPTTTYMAVDPRRDHSLRVPRPDLSVELGTPNACTGCHLEPDRLDAEDLAPLKQYADWLEAARDGNAQVQQELDRLDRWSKRHAEDWYGPKRDDTPHFAHALAAGWKAAPSAESDLTAVALNHRAAGIVRASALDQLGQSEGRSWLAACEKALKDRDPQVRAAAVASLQPLPNDRLIALLAPLLEDPVRLVRTEAGRLLARVPRRELTQPQRDARRAAIDDYERGLMIDNDQAAAHMSLGILYEAMATNQRNGRDLQKAVDAYRTAINVQPDMTGPRTNLASVMDRVQPEQAKRLRAEELVLLARDARLVPDSASLQYRYGLSLYLNGRQEEAEEALTTACRLEPNSPDFLLALTLLCRKQRRWVKALRCAEGLVKLRPDDRSYQQVLQDIRAQAAWGSTFGPQSP